MTQLVIHHYAKPATRGKLGVGMLMAVVAIVFAGEQSAHWLGVHPMAAHGLAASLLAGGFAIMTTLGADF